MHVKKIAFLVVALFLGSHCMRSMDQLQVQEYKPPIADHGFYGGTGPGHLNISALVPKPKGLLLDDEIKELDVFKGIKDCFEIESYASEGTVRGKCLANMLKNYANIDVESECKCIIKNHVTRKDRKQKRTSPEFKEKMNALGEKVYTWFEDTADKAEDFLKLHKNFHRFLQRSFFRGQGIKSSSRSCFVESKMPTYKQIWKDLGEIIRCQMSQSLFEDRECLEQFFKRPVTVCELRDLGVEVKNEVCYSCYIYFRSQLEKMVRENPLEIIENKDLFSLVVGGDGNTIFCLWARFHPESIEQLIANYPKERLVKDINRGRPLYELLEDFSDEVLAKAAQAMIDAGADIGKYKFILKDVIYKNPGLAGVFLAFGIKPSGPDLYYTMGLNGGAPVFFAAKTFLHDGFNPNDNLSFFQALDGTRFGNNAHKIALLLSYDVDLFCKRKPFNDSSGAIKKWRARCTGQWLKSYCSPMEYLQKLLEEKITTYDLDNDDWYSLRYSAALMIDVARGKKLVRDTRLTQSDIDKHNCDCCVCNELDFLNWRGFTSLQEAVIAQDIDEVKRLMRAYACPYKGSIFGLSARAMNKQILRAFSPASYWGQKALIIADLLDGKEPTIEVPEKPEDIKQDMQFVLKEITRLIRDHKWGRLSFLASLWPNIWGE